MKRLLVLIVVLVIVAGASIAGAYWWMTRPGPSISRTPPPASIYANSESEFKDDVTTNSEVTADQLDLEFVDRTGKPVRLSDYRGKKHLVLVFLRGLTKVPGGLCPSCNAQTSRLVANHAEFAKRDAEVLIVFPGSKEQVAQFVNATQMQTKQEAIPFAILLDENYQVVEKLRIRADAAKPSTFILDKEGQLRFAYVGATTADRPSLAALFKQLDGLAPAKKVPG
jgi:peroxiredoxin